ncbi:MAG: imidazolonepropionase [Ignavibacteriales bacterium]|nr:MAG: imidazolonepropionase [Ignavibacteriaceae bacterium]MBW7872270.1 imidazolonepropionase [Ignavibacteria bacterium]MCZ2142552.1 imidazolonepropionase [Ignavibacteriales bacterium]OQY75239.1 MAG: imidazolonepropionase [Ignavibacteriales bacterium UTCHB3]MBV6445583.1 Imidazolonepropionase [Ignavibacteriaceae bacterium]
MLKRIKEPSRILTLTTEGTNIAKGLKAQNLSPLEGFDVVLENGLIKDFVPSGSYLATPHEVIDAHGKLLLPGFVECHTHSLFTGDRSTEYIMKLEGRSYEEISAAGGGIVSTVKALRNTNEDTLLKLLLTRVDYFILQGVTTLEIKSGYGLDYESELKMLRVINRVKQLRQTNIVPCFLGAHTVPPEFKQNREGYLELLTEKLLPKVAEQKLAGRCDAFCESTAFSAEEVSLVFSRAKELGFNLTLHTEQFNNIGGLELALKMGVLSVDHLEVLKDEQISSVVNSDSVAVLLPGVSFTLNYQYAPARKLIDAGATVALSTDYNPGTSNINSIFLIMALAARQMKMKSSEILSAYTINAAAALGVSDEVGSLEIGKRADLTILNLQHEDQIVYNTAQNFNEITMVNGEVVYSKNQIRQSGYEK